VFSDLKPLHWVGSSKKDLLSMPSDVVDGIETPKQDLDLIRERLKAAQAHAKGA
jgi:phage-related protein